VTLTIASMHNISPDETDIRGCQECEGRIVLHGRLERAIIGFAAKSVEDRQDSFHTFTAFCWPDCPLAVVRFALTAPLPIVCLPINPFHPSAFVGCGKPHCSISTTGMPHVALQLSTIGRCVPQREDIKVGRRRPSSSSFFFFSSSASVSIPSRAVL